MCWGCQVGNLCKTISIDGNVKIVDVDEKINFEGKYILPATNCFSYDTDNNYFLSKLYSQKFAKNFIFKILKLIDIKKSEILGTYKISYNFDAINSEGNQVCVSIFKITYNNPIEDINQKLQMIVIIKGRVLTEEEIHKRNIPCEEKNYCMEGNRKYIIDVEVCEDGDGKSPFFKY